MLTANEKLLINIWQVCLYCS